MSKMLKMLLVAGAFAVATVSVQAFACDAHGDGEEASAPVEGEKVAKKADGKKADGKKAEASASKAE